MLEILAIAAASVLMYKIADADEQSPGLWCAVTVALCIGSVFLLPSLPLLRVLLAAGAAFIAMIVKKVVSDS